MSGDLDLGAYRVNMTDKLGQGTFGVVYSGEHRKTGERVAVKQCEIKNDKHGSMAMVEIKNFQQLENHGNIVKLFDFHYQKSSFWMVMEFCDAGDLVDYMKQNSPALDAMLSIMYQCASALAYMHTRPNPVIHRDIKPANIMMKKEGSAINVKVTDFGLSKIVEAPDPAKTILFTTAAGTPGFMAPEFFNRVPYTKSVDVFALGLVFVAMINFKKGDKELLPIVGVILLPVGAIMAQAVSMGYKIPEVAEIQDGDCASLKRLKTLIKRMCCYEGKQRISMSDAEAELARLGGTSTWPPPAAEEASGRSLKLRAENEETEPRVQCAHTDTEGSTSTSGGSDESVDVGFKLLKKALDPMFQNSFMLLKEALDQALKDKMKTEDQEKYRREMRDIPFTSLLKQVLGEERVVDKFEVGDKVEIERSYKRAMDLQKGHGEWNVQMKPYLGRVGVVKEKVLHVLKIKFDDGQVWSFNPELCFPPGKAKERPEGTPLATVMETQRDLVFGMFKRYDVVKLPEDEEVIKVCQQRHGGWNPKMKRCLGVKGIVNRVDSDGDVYVECINGDNWTMNPEILTHVDMSREKIEAGDFVLIYDDKQKAKQLQEDHGGWVESMAVCLGKTGVIQSVADNRAKVEIKNRSFIWYQACLKLVAKGEEMMKAVLQKKL